jgi:hypothetical protein
MVEFLILLRHWETINKSETSQLSLFVCGSINKILGVWFFPSLSLSGTHLGLSLCKQGHFYKHVLMFMYMLLLLMIFPLKSKTQVSGPKDPFLVLNPFQRVQIQIK